jgi:hypothetical protein
MGTCCLCLRPCKEDLCKYHSKLFIWDSSIGGFRIKKRSLGSRYTNEPFHKSESQLVRLIEQYFGRCNVITGYHPEWAIGDKGALLEYDILLKEQKILIEYEGIQHYEYPNFFHPSKKEFKEQINRDYLKQQLALENGYKLVIFKYDEPIFKDYIVQKIIKSRSK